MAWAKRTGGSRKRSAPVGSKAPRKLAKKVATIGRELKAQTQTCYFSYELQQEMSSIFVIPTMNIALWNQTFDITTSQADRHLPQAQVKSIGMDFLIECGASQQPFSFTCFYVSLTKAGQGFFGGPVTNGSMVEGQSYKAISGLSALLNKDLFNIHKQMRFSIGGYTYAAAVSPQPHNAVLDQSKKRCYHVDKKSTVVKDTVSGWSSATDHTLPYYDKRYWIIFNEKIAPSSIDAHPVIHYNQIATVTY